MSDQAKNIKKMREELGVSQTTLAKMLGVTTSTIGNWENGRRKPSQSVITAIKSFLDKRIDNSPPPLNQSATEQVEENEILKAEIVKLKARIFDLQEKLDAKR